MELTDKELKYVLNEMHKILLTEDQQSDSMKKAMQLYMKTKGCSKEEADKFIRINIRMMVSCLHQRKPGKFVLGVTRMYLNNELADEDTQKALDATIEYISKSEEYNHYDKNLNGESAMSIIKKYEEALKQERQRQKEQIASQEYKNESQYDIVRIDSFEQSSTYSQYTWEESRWCITTSEWAFNNYTHNGLSQFYFCLKKGYQGIQPIKGENCPLDEYGTSMVAVLVDSDGELEKCTCRWNHDNGGSDKVMNVVQISELIGKDFYSIFKPNNFWGENLKRIEEKLKNGEDIHDVFEKADKITDNIYIVSIASKKNIWDNNKKTFLNNVWHTIMYTYSIKKNLGVMRIVGDKKEYFLTFDGHLYNEDEFYSDLSNRVLNYLNEGGTIQGMEGSILDSVWYSSSLGYTLISTFDKYNLLSPDGTLEFTKWCNMISTMKHNDEIYFIVRQNSNDDCHLLNSDKQDVLGRGFRTIRSSILYNKWIQVDMDNLCLNFININNPEECACKRCFKVDINMINENIFVGADNYGSYIICNKNGEDLLGYNIENFIKCYNDKHLIINKDRKYNVLDMETNSTLPFWFDGYERVYPTPDAPYLPIYINDKHYLINLYSTSDDDLILFGEWFDDIKKGSSFDKYFILTKNGKKTMIGYNGETILEKWYDDVIPLNTYDLFIIKDNSKCNIFNYSTYGHKSNSFLLDEWVDNIEYEDGMIKIIQDGVTKTSRPFDIIYTR